jgi:mono/diheme cytochrome c family protein
VSRLESYGAALIVVGALLGVVFALGLYQWETSARAALALANPSPTPTLAPPGPTPTIALVNQPAGIPTVGPTDTPAATVTAASSPTAAPVTPSPAASPAAGSPTAAVTAAVAATATVAPTAAPAATNTPPASTGNAVAGGKVFATNCNSCHPSGKAGIGPALYGPQFRALLPDDPAIKAIIRSGKDGMPAFPSSNLSDSDLNNVIAYLHTLK